MKSRAQPGPLIPGVTIAMAGRDWMVPPLTIGQLRRLLPKIRSIRNLGVNMESEDIASLVEVVLAAMQRNYPEMTAEALEEHLDLGNSKHVLTAVLTGSGLTTEGEAEAAMSTGAKSMGSSPPPPDTVTP